MKTTTLWPLFLFLAACIICAGVFLDVLPLMTVLQAPDAMPSFAPSSLLRRMLPWMNGTQTSLTHDDLLKILPATVYHELSFIVSTGLLALAMGTYLHALGLPVAACIGGGLTLAFSGYHFTLFNAGHRGYFIMMPYAVFLFALVEFALRKPRWFHFALMPLCVVAGLATQPDVLLLILFVLAPYGLFRLIGIVKETGFQPYFAAHGRRLLFGIAVLLVTSGLFGYRTVNHVLTVTMASREAQITETTTAMRAQRVAAGADADETDAHARWIFATNWSLPPEAMAEFIAPCLRGLDTNNPKGPYWGRIGRSLGWETTREGFHNFRQHTLYLGAIPVSLALFAILAAGLTRKHDTHAAAPRLRALTCFWAVTFLMALLLALGRHAPFYRLFYAIPYMDRIRAPLKFIHISEIAIAVLFAFGLTRLLGLAHESNPGRLRLTAKITVGVLALGALVCLIARLAFDADGAAAVWTSMGIPPGGHHDALAHLFTRALMRAAWMLGLGGAAIGLVLLPTSARFRAQAALPCVLLLIAASTLDLAEVGRRFVVGESIAHKFEGNPIIRTLEPRGPIDGQAFSYIQLTRQILPGRVPFLDALSTAGLANMDPVAEDGPDAFRVAVFRALHDDPVKRWAFWGATAVLVDPDGAREMIRAGQGRILGLFDLDDRLRLISPASVQSGRVAVVEPLHPIPAAAVYHGWQVADTADALSRIARDDFDPHREIVVSGEGVQARPAERAHTPAEWMTAPSQTRGNVARVRVSTDAPGMLMLREHRMRSIPVTARVNGKPVPLFTANGLFLCVPVEAGESTVVIRPALSFTAIAGTLAALAFSLLAFGACFRDAFKGGHAPGETAD